MRPQVIISQTICYFFSLKMDFVLANSVDPDEMLHDAAFHQGLHFLPKYLFRGFQSTKGQGLFVYFSAHSS